MIDTHTHLYLEEFEENPGEGKINGESAVERAIEAGVSHMIFPNVDMTTVSPLLTLHNHFPEHTSVAAGLHPTEVRPSWRSDIRGIFKSFEPYGSTMVAVGEIGIDLYWDKTYENLQMEAFGHQCGLARAWNLPVIIHCRQGLDNVLEVIEGYPGLHGVFHCFSGTAQDVERVRRKGDFYFGFGGTVTFKNSHPEEVVNTVGIDRILLETDSPYLAPVPYRGKRNESSFLPAVNARIAAILSMSAEEVEDRTDINAMTLFRRDKVRFDR